VTATSNKVYTKSSDIVLQKANEGVFQCGIYDEKSGIFRDGTLFPEHLNYIYGPGGAQVEIKEDGIHFSGLMFWRGKIAGTVGSANQNMTVMSLLITAATTETIQLKVPWAEIRGIVVMNDSNRIYLFYNHAKKKRLEWLDILIGVETSTGVKFNSDQDLERKSYEIFLEKCRAKGVKILPIE
jgi:hypothetical protein